MPTTPDTTIDFDQLLQQFFNQVSKPDSECPIFSPTAFDDIEGSPHESTTFSVGLNEMTQQGLYGDANPPLASEEDAMLQTGQRSTGLLQTPILRCTSRESFNSVDNCHNDQSTYLRPVYTPMRPGLSRGSSFSDSSVFAYDSTFADSPSAIDNDGFDDLLPTLSFPPEGNVTGSSSQDAAGVTEDPVVASTSSDAATLLAPSIALLRRDHAGAHKCTKPKTVHSLPLSSSYSSPGTLSPEEKKDRRREKRKVDSKAYRERMKKKDNEKDFKITYLEGRVESLQKKCDNLLTELSNERCKTSLLKKAVDALKQACGCGKQYKHQV